MRGINIDENNKKQIISFIDKFLTYLNRSEVDQSIKDVIDNVSERDTIINKIIEDVTINVNNIEEAISFTLKQKSVDPDTGSSSGAIQIGNTVDPNMLLDTTTFEIPQNASDVDRLILENQQKIINQLNTMTTKIGSSTNTPSVPAGVPTADSKNDNSEMIKQILTAIEEMQMNNQNSSDTKKIVTNIKDIQYNLEKKTTQINNDIEVLDPDLEKVKNGSMTANDFARFNQDRMLEMFGNINIFKDNIFYLKQMLNELKLLDKEGEISPGDWGETNSDKLTWEKFKANIQKEIDDYESKELIDFNRAVIQYEKYSVSTRIINDITDLKLSEEKPLDIVEEKPLNNEKDNLLDKNKGKTLEKTVFINNKYNIFRRLVI
jgi:hypothetical protein